MEKGIGACMIGSINKPALAEIFARPPHIAPRLVIALGAPNEKIVSRELGYYGEFPAEHLQLDVRWFNDELDLTEHNLEIENFVITPNYRHQQRGVEVSGQWRP